MLLVVQEGYWRSAMYHSPDNVHLQLPCGIQVLVAIFGEWQLSFVLIHSVNRNGKEPLGITVSLNSPVYVSASFFPIEQ